MLAVITGLIVVNIVNPGEGISKELVEDARKEGEETISHAAGRNEPRKIEWHNVTGDRSQVAGVSKNVSVPDGGAWNIRVAIDQVGDAQSGAKAELEWSADGNQFHPVEGGEFVAGEEAGIHRAAAPFQLPEEASYARIVFTPEPATENSRSIVEAYLVPGPPSIGEIFQNLVLMLFTGNLLGSMVQINLLPLIVFSIVFGGMLTTMGERSKTITDLVVSINDALMSFILLLMKLAPLGIFCLVAARFSKAQMDGQFLALLKTQAWYMTTVLTGLGCHALITLPILLWVFTRRNPVQFFQSDVASDSDRVPRPPVRRQLCRSRWSAPKSEPASRGVRPNSYFLSEPRSIWMAPRCTKPPPRSSLLKLMPSSTPRSC